MGKTNVPAILCRATWNDGKRREVLLLLFTALKTSDAQRYYLIKQGLPAINVCTVLDFNFKYTSNTQKEICFYICNIKG